VCSLNGLGFAAGDPGSEQSPGRGRASACMTVGSFGGRPRVHNRSVKDGPSVASCEQRRLSAVNCKYSTGVRTGPTNYHDAAFALEKTRFLAVGCPSAKAMNSFSPAAWAFRMVAVMPWRHSTTQRSQNRLRLWPSG
jgi:hypothetical protein